MAIISWRLSDHNVLSEGERWIGEGPPGSPKEAALKNYLARFGEHWVGTRASKARHRKYA